jgi:hypothetical protein
VNRAAAARLDDKEATLPADDAFAGVSVKVGAVVVGPALSSKAVELGDSADDDGSSSSQTPSVAVTTVYTVLHPTTLHPWSQGNERYTVGAAVGQPSQPAVMVAGTTQSMVKQVLQTSVVETTAAHPET